MKIQCQSCLGKTDTFSVEIHCYNAIQCYVTFNRISQDCHPLPLRGVVDGTRTRKPMAYLVPWLILTIYFDY